LDRNPAQERFAIPAQAQVANTASDSIGAWKIEQWNERVGTEKVALLSE
jgi:hypothetical protein